MMVTTGTDEMQQRGLKVLANQRKYLLIKYTSHITQYTTNFNGFYRGFNSCIQ